MSGFVVGFPIFLQTPNLCSIDAISEMSWVGSYDSGISKKFLLHVHEAERLRWQMLCGRKLLEGELFNQ